MEDTPDAPMRAQERRDTVICSSYLPISRSPVSAGDGLTEKPTTPTVSIVMFRGMGAVVPLKRPQMPLGAFEASLRTASRQHEAFLHHLKTYTLYWTSVVRKTVSNCSVGRIGKLLCGF